MPQLELDPARRHMTAEDRYESLKSERQPYLDRGRAAAKLTLSALIPEEGDNASTELTQAYQSIGARGVNHLAAKLLLALMPPGRSFFRLTISEYVEEELTQEAGAGFEDAKAEIDEALIRVEKTVMTRLEQTGARSTINEVLKHLLVAGNVLLFVNDDGSLKLHPLSAYVVKRDKSGQVIEVVVKETVARMALPEEARKVLESLGGDLDTDPSDESGRDDVDIFTRVTRTTGNWKIHQEVGGKKLEDSEGTYPLDKTPWVPLRFVKVDGEDYGRGFIEEYFGDLRSCEALNKAIVLFAAAASKIILFVDDNGYVTIKQVADAESGDVLPGRSDSVSVLQLDKPMDFKVANEVLVRIEGRLEQAFLLFSSAQRNAERVTAEEIRAVINELEQGLGGVYSVLAQELQAPLVRRIMHQMAKSKDIPALPDDTINPEITTGVDALGRSSDLRRLDLFVAGLAETFGPDRLGEVLRMSAYMQRRANALDLDLEGLVKTDEEIAQEREAAMQAQIAQQVAPEAAKQSLQQQEN